MKVAASRAALIAAVSLLAACGSGGDSNGGDGGGSGHTVTVSGRITFDRVPVDSSGLNFSAITRAPARGIVVEAIDASSSSILASGTTNANGQYSLAVPGNRSIRIRAKAQMTQSGASAWNFRVLNNTNGNALYALDSAAFETDSSSTRDLNAPSGWGGSAYTGTRAAAPFAILDTVYEAKELLLSAQPNLAFPALDLFWSATNRSSDTFCPSAGNIGTTSFVTGNTGDTDDCSTPRALQPGIYVLGDSSDSDEFDQHVIAHEFGHYVEAYFSRSDSIGGRHSLNEPLDMRVAFSEGWSNAFSAMVLRNPVYRDSFDLGQVGSFNIEDNSVGVNGWYSEASVMQILWDLFDSEVEPGVDNLQLPFASLFAALAGAQKTTPALTSIFSYANALLVVEAGRAAAIESLLASEGVNSTDPFGVGETNFGAEGATMQNTVYASIIPGSTVNVCTSGQAGVYNKLNNRRFLKLDLSQSGTSTHSILLQGATTSALHDPSEDPDIIIWRRGEWFATGFKGGTTETLASRQFPADVYILEVFDAGFGWPTGARSTRPRCMNVTVN